MMNKKAFLLSMPIIAFGAYAYNVDYSYVGGNNWNGTVTIVAKETIDLTKNPLKLTFSQGGATSFWADGSTQTPINTTTSATQSGDVVTLNFGTNWTTGQDYVLQPGQSITLAFSWTESSGQNPSYQITNVSVGDVAPVQEQGTVNFSQAPGATVPSGTKLNFKNSSTGSVVSVDYVSLGSTKLNYGTYAVSASGVAVTPSNISVSATPQNITVGTTPVVQQGTVKMQAASGAVIPTGTQVSFTNTTTGKVTTVSYAANASITLDYGSYTVASGSLVVAPSNISVSATAQTVTLGKAVAVKQGTVKLKAATNVLLPADTVLTFVNTANGSVTNANYVSLASVKLPYGAYTITGNSTQGAIPLTTQTVNVGATVQNIIVGVANTLGSVKFKTATGVTLPSDTQVSFTNPVGGSKTVAYVAGGSVKLPKDTYSVVAFSSSGAIAVVPGTVTVGTTVQTLTVGSTHVVSQGSVQVGQTANTQALPNDVTVTFTNDVNGKVVSFPYTSGMVQKLDYGTYSITATSATQGNIAISSSSVVISSLSQSVSIGNPVEAQKASVFITVEGLPLGQSTTLSLVGSNGSVIPNVQNGLNKEAYKILPGEYTLTATPVMDANSEYTASSQTVQISAGNNSFVVAFAKQSATAGVPFSYSYMGGNLWTGNLRITANQDINLTKNPIKLTLSQGAASSAWWDSSVTNPVSAGISSSLNGKVLTISFGTKWSDGKDAILESGKTISLNFGWSGSVDGSSSPNYKVTDVTVGEFAIPRGTLQFDTAQSSEAIPADTQIQVTGGGQVYNFSYQSGMKQILNYGNYSITASSGYGGIYTITPSNINLIDGSVKPITIKYQKPIMGSVKVNVVGLPTNAKTTLVFGKSSSTTFADVANGTNTVPYSIPVGATTLSATSVLDGGYIYTLKEQNVTIEQGNNTLNLYFDKAVKPDGLVKGWPSYIAQVGVTNMAGTAQFAGAQVDGVFKYDGDGGNGDPGRIMAPLVPIKTSKLANDLSTPEKKVIPVLVVYTAQMSGGVAYTDFNNSDYVLTKHFINLMLTSQVLQENGAGSIVLNADLLGMIQQNPPVLAHLLSMNIQNREAMNMAYYFISMPRTYTLSTGQNFTGTPLQLYNYMIKNMGLDYYTAEVQWQSLTNATFDDIVKNKATIAVTKGANVPEFADTIQGWVQANNWIIKNFAPSISFGWVENMWASGSAWWIHDNLTPQQIDEQQAKTNTKIFETLGVYNGAYRPDYLAVDRYEMDDSACYGSGFLLNQKDLTNYFTWLEYLSKNNDNVPIMLFQYPGSHVGADQTTWSTTAQYVFGFNKEQFVFPSGVGNQTLNTTAYKVPVGTTLNQYVSDMDGKPHWDVLKKANVFSILWGGGSTTSVGTVPRSDGGWLSNNINQFYKDPVYLDQK